MDGKMKRADDEQSLKTERVVTDAMLEMGVPAHLNGFRFLRTSIAMCLEDMELVSSVTKLLYPDVAKYYRTTEQKIERAIRNAIEVSWERGNIHIQEELFGYSAREGRNRPTNSEFIARIADMILLDSRENGE